MDVHMHGDAEMLIIDQCLHLDAMLQYMLRCPIASSACAHMAIASEVIFLVVMQKLLGHEACTLAAGVLTMFAIHLELPVNKCIYGKYM